MKNLENYGVQKMNAKDMEEVNGGVLSLLAVCLIVGGITVVGIGVGLAIAYYTRK